MLEVLETSEPRNVRRVIPDSSGAGRTLEILFSPLKDERGHVTRVIETFRDITREVKLERQLHESQKLEAIGTLAGGIAHDFNNALGIIFLCNEMALLDVKDDSKAAVNLENALQAARRARELVKQILTFCRQREHTPVTIGLIPIIKETVKLLRASLPSTIKISERLNVPSGEDVVLADPTQLHQVMMNLCANSAHAMKGEGGVLEVGLTHVDFEASSYARPHELAPGRYLRLIVSDTGKGMDRQVLERIFEPFFTTKAQGEGTGLGLSVVHGIVKSCGGAIKVYSEPGRGATFNVYLPLFQGCASAQTEPVSRIMTGNGRVLLVDDEKELAEAGRQALQYLGYEVCVKTNSMEALECFLKSPERFDLVVTDQTMPGVTGIELSKEILKIRPELPIILCTGFSESVTANEAEDSGIREFVMKPLMIRDLAEAITNARNGKDANAQCSKA